MDASTGLVVNILAKKRKSNTTFVAITGKGTCGCKMGEIEDVYNGLFLFCMWQKNNNYLVL